MLQCVAVFCSVLQYFAVFCSVLQRVAACCSVLQSPWYLLGKSSSKSMCCRVSQRVAMCCSALQRDAVCCSVLQCVAIAMAPLSSKNACHTNITDSTSHLNVTNTSSAGVAETPGFDCHGTGWRRPMSCLKLQVTFRKRDTDYRALLRTMTYKGKVSYASSPHCTSVRTNLWYIMYAVPAYIQLSGTYTFPGVNDSSKCRELIECRCCGGTSCTLY